MITLCGSDEKQLGSVKREKVKLFVYGTLKEGFRAHSLVQPCKIVYKNVKTFGKMYTQPEEYFPVVFPCDDGKLDFIMGDIYEIEMWMLERVDRYEGHPYLFTRTPIHKVQTTNGDWIKIDSTFIYMYNLKREKESYNYVHIPSGIWSKV